MTKPHFNVIEFEFDTSKTDTLTIRVYFDKFLGEPVRVVLAFEIPKKYVEKKFDSYVLERYKIGFHKEDAFLEASFILMERWNSLDKKAVAEIFTTLITYMQEMLEISPLEENPPKKITRKTLNGGSMLAFSLKEGQI